MREGVQFERKRGKSMTNYRNEIRTVVDLISISVRTAPKSAGIDDIIFLSVSRKQIDKIAKEMIKVGEIKAKKREDEVAKQATMISWESDAKTLYNSEAVILIGVRGKKAAGLNCGGCGFKNCKEFSAYAAKQKNLDIIGPFCMFKIWDLGIAISSAARTASELCVDNRIMYRIGTAAFKLNILQPKQINSVSDIINPILGLPLSVSGKNIYFDRLDKLQAAQTLKNHFHKGIK